MDRKQVDRIEAYVKANGECTENDVAIALDLHIFDVLEGLGQLERLGKLRSEPIEPGDAPLPEHLTS